MKDCPASIKSWIIWRSSRFAVLKGVCIQPYYVLALLCAWICVGLCWGRQDYGGQINGCWRIESFWLKRFFAGNVLEYWILYLWGSHLIAVAMDWEWIGLFGGICVLTGEWERRVCRQCICFRNFKSVIWTDLEHFESAFVVLLAINYCYKSSVEKVTRSLRLIYTVLGYLVS